ncbi:hypothetical protein V6N13_032362 [Hibiscus sabdariffa]
MVFSPYDSHCSLPLSTPKPCSQIQVRNVLVCLLGRVVFPSKNNVRLFPMGLVRFGSIFWWCRRRGRRKGSGVSVQFHVDLGSGGVVNLCMFPSTRANYWRQF